PWESRNRSCGPSVSSISSVALGSPRTPLSTNIRASRRSAIPAGNGCDGPGDVLITNTIAVKTTEAISAIDRKAWRRRSRRRSSSSRLIRATEFSADDMGLVHLSEQDTLRLAETGRQHVLNRTGGQGDQDGGQRDGSAHDRSAVASPPIGAGPGPYPTS